MKLDIDTEAVITIRGGMTAGKLVPMLRGMPSTWRVYGTRDGTLIIGPPPTKQTTDETDETTAEDE